MSRKLLLKGVIPFFRRSTALDRKTWICIVSVSWWMFPFWHLNNNIFFPYPRSSQMEAEKKLEPGPNSLRARHCINFHGTLDNNNNNKKYGHLMTSSIVQTIVKVSRPITGHKTNDWFCLLPLFLSTKWSQAPNSINKNLQFKFSDACFKLLKGSYKD